MPKGRKIIKTDGRVKKVYIQSKLRIGTRKSGTGANTMTNTALLEVMKDEGKTRHHGKARTVLNARGVSFE